MVAICLIVTGHSHVFSFLAYSIHLHAGPLSANLGLSANVLIALFLPFGSTHSAAGSAGSAGLSSWYHVIRLLLHSAHGSLIDRESKKERWGKMKLGAQVFKLHLRHSQVSMIYSDYVWGGLSRHRKEDSEDSAA